MKREFGPLLDKTIEYAAGNIRVEQGETDVERRHKQGQRNHPAVFR
jgi:hypothetical protein